MDNLGPLPKSTQGYQHVVVMADRYSRLTRAVLTAKRNATQIANIFLDHRIIPFGIQNYVLTDNGAQFVIKFFATTCGDLGIKHSTTAAYHPQTNAQVERYNEKIVTRLRHYIADHQRDRDVFVQPLGLLLLQTNTERIHLSKPEAPKH